MTQLEIPNTRLPLLSSLETRASICSGRLIGILTVCSQNMEHRDRGRTDISHWYFDKSFSNEVLAEVERIIQISWSAANHKDLQSEIRNALLSSHRDRHDELYYVQISSVLTNLKKCVTEVERYLSNQVAYNSYLETCDPRMTVDDVNAISDVFSKLAPGRYSGNLLDSANHLIIAIKSVIPAADLHRVLPVDELPIVPTSTDQEPVPVPAEPGGKLRWKGDKTDLAELVWALAKSGRVTDTSTGKPATQKEIGHNIAALLEVESLDVIGLMKGRMRTYKATNDGNTFLKTLFELVSDRAATA